MQDFNPKNNVVTKDLPTSTINRSAELSIAEKNSKFTRLVWRTHNDFHKHKFWEICLVLKGKGKHHFSSRTYDMYAGAMWLLRPNDVHKIEPLPQTSSRDTAYAHRDIYVEEDTMKRILNAFDADLYYALLNAEKPLFSVIPLQELNNIESMISYYSLNESRFEFMHAVLTSHVIACAIEQNNYLVKKDKPEWINNLLANLNKIDFMTMPIKEIVSAIGYSQEHVCREFKKYTGTTLGKYIQRIKCMYSLSLLTDKSIPIVDIANKLYFPDESNFITAFKKIYNITPGEWRKQINR
ncbi:MAG: AraC family transcriptional regulator [Clostridia bacterium]|nr:AraC family transcriptional regulator [Clostridia bacterium]